MFSIEYNSLDEAIDDAVLDHPDLLSVSKLVRGRNPPPQKKQKVSDKKPVVAVEFNTKRGKAKPVILKALLDSGGSGTIVLEKHAKKLRVKKTPSKTVWTTPAGKLVTDSKCLALFRLPELHEDRILEFNIHMAKNLGAYDMIIGRDLMADLGIDLRFSDEKIEWDDSQIPFKDEEEFNIIQEAYALGKEVPLDNDYEEADLEQVCREQTQLNEEEQQKLLTCLRKHESLFDGTLGKWNMDPYELELKEGAQPYHAKAFPVPQKYLETLKKEVYRLCRVGVLKKVNRSEWAAPTFIIPKKDGKIRFVSDLRELNKRIKRKPYPIPKVQDMMLRLQGFMYATALDLNMGYYHVELTPNSKRYCTIVLPFGKFEYQRLPQGISVGPDIFQEKMSELFEGIDYVRAYIDDILVITKGSFDDHLDKLSHTFEKLQEAGLKINAKKSFFARTELEYLGYWVTREGIQPQTKKVEAIKKIVPPKNRRELRRFIGIINYYRDMWIRRSHILAPLARLTSKDVRWKWTDVEQKAFDTMKRVIARDVLLAYPDFSKKFVIHTDASHFQLGAVISQEGKPIAFYSRKLNPAQTRYTTTERELLSIVETLKEFRNILLGYEIEIHTDHKNLTCKNFNTERVMRWRLILEEYGPKLVYIKGEHNIVADALSRLDMTSEPIPQLKKEEAAELFANTTADESADEYPLTYEAIFEAQQEDQELHRLFQTSPKYSRKQIAYSDKTYDLIVREYRIVLPKKLQGPAVRWYHQQLMHPGESRTEATIAQHYYWKGMREMVQRSCRKCALCQITKAKTQKKGQIPVKENVEVRPWHTLCIDLIGPYYLGQPKKKSEKKKTKEEKSKVTLHCLTMIDPATGWFEIARIDNKESMEVANVLEQKWLTRYPWPTEVICDRGREFMGAVKDMLKDDYGVSKKMITTRNPQANSMVERAHQTVHNMIRTNQLHADPNPEERIDGILSAIGFAMRSTYHTTLKATPSQLVFGRDAILNVGFQADWEYIRQNKERRIIQNNARENAKRDNHQYAVNDQVMVKQRPHRKHGSKDLYARPFTVTAVNDNGTVRLARNTQSGGVVHETRNVRAIYPYHA